MKMKLKIRRLLTSFLFSAGIGLAAGYAEAMPYSDVVIFGDSLSDSGNLFGDTGFPPAPYFNGQFSNGPVWASTFAQKLGLSAAPLSQGGQNYAYAGATTGPTGVPNGAPTLIEQQQNYLTSHGGVGDPNALYVVFGGGNDIADALQTDDPSLIASGVGNVVSIITSLYTAGARNILVANVPDIGSTPLAKSVGPSAQLFGTLFSSTWNSALSNALSSLSGLSGLDLDVLDIFGLESKVFADPAAYGYTNITDPCFDGVSVCANPNEYFYWDSFHPTETGHLLIADAALAVIPEPPAMLLIGVGLLALALRRRQSV